MPSPAIYSDGALTTTTMSETTCTMTWIYWNVAYDSTAVDTVWTFWNQASSSDTSIHILTRPTPVVSRASPRPRHVEVLIEEADKRAEAILLASLTPAQREMYKNHRYFELRTRSGLYRLYHGWAGNIARINEGDGGELCRFCIHPQVQIPAADNLLAQKLMLQFEEDRFLKVANMHPPRVVAA